MAEQQRIDRFLRHPRLSVLRCTTASSQYADERSRHGQEASELHAAVDRSEIPAEAADVIEVVIALAAYYGFSLNDVAKEANRRRDERGGFLKRLWLD
ncbi:MAG: pyrophosphohydrolase domain-containing protein [Ilumatobacteraceae bacterium]